VVAAPPAAAPKLTVAPFKDDPLHGGPTGPDAPVVEVVVGGATVVVVVFLWVAPRVAEGLPPEQAARVRPNTATTPRNARDEPRPVRIECANLVLVIFVASVVSSIFGGLSLHLHVTNSGRCDRPTARRGEGPRRAPLHCCVRSSPTETFPAEELDSGLATRP